MRRIILLILLVATSVQAQSKVGTTTDEFLNIETSVPAIAMGQAGILVPEDANFVTNPGLLAITNRKGIQLGGNPWRTEVSYLFKCRTGYASLAFPIPFRKSEDQARDSTWRVAIGYRLFESALGPFYQHGYGSGNFDTIVSVYYPKFSAHQISLGISHTRPVEFGVGGSVKFAKEEFTSPSITSTLYDLGIFGRMSIVGDRDWTRRTHKMKVRGMVGAAVTNFGPTVEYLGSEFHLPRLYRFAFGAEALSGDFRLLVSWQQNRVHITTTSQTHLGGELEWRRAVTFRAGYVWNDDPTGDLKAIGGSVSVASLASLVRRGIKLPCDLRVHYARTMASPVTPYGGLDYWSLQLVI